MNQFLECLLSLEFFFFIKFRNHIFVCFFSLMTLNFHCVCQNSSAHKRFSFYVNILASSKPFNPFYLPVSFSFFNIYSRIVLFCDNSSKVPSMFLSFANFSVSLRFGTTIATQNVSVESPCKKISYTKSFLA